MESSYEVRLRDEIGHRVLLHARRLVQLCYGCAPRPLYAHRCDPRDGTCTMWRVTIEVRASWPTTRAAVWNAHVCVKNETTGRRLCGWGCKRVCARDDGGTLRYWWQTVAREEMHKWRVVAMFRDVYFCSVTGAVHLCGVECRKYEEGAAANDYHTVCSVTGAILDAHLGNTAVYGEFEMPRGRASRCQRSVVMDDTAACVTVPLRVPFVQESAPRRDVLLKRAVRHRERLTKTTGGASGSSALSARYAQRMQSMLPSAMSRDEQRLLETIPDYRTWLNSVVHGVRTYRELARVLREAAAARIRDFYGAVDQYLRVICVLLYVDFCPEKVEWIEEARSTEHQRILARCKASDTSFVLDRMLMYDEMLTASDAYHIQHVALVPDEVKSTVLRVARRVYCFWRVLRCETKSGRAVPGAFPVAFFVQPALAIFSEGCVVDGVRLLVPDPTIHLLFGVNSARHIFSLMQHRFRSEEAKEMSRALCMHGRWNGIVKRNVLFALRRALVHEALPRDRFFGAHLTTSPADDALHARVVFSARPETLSEEKVARTRESSGGLSGFVG